ncbi:MBL fold metallo-hydrolase [Paenibacillus sp. NPDC093718]|uniref:MBL fold metallo-hydrolase n=1 Tax=Paenibacillus sp. NPDC093718 TaxID=3390601 RepID=UPI003D07C86F
MGTTYQLEVIRTSSPGFINYCYLVMDCGSKEALLVDPAWELQTITDRLDQLGAELKAIALTHSHADHVNLVASLSTIYEPDVYMSEAEIHYYSFDCPKLKGLKDGDQLRLGDTIITALLTPGHSAGGMCYLLEDCVFTGDTLFAEGCGACDGKGASAEQMFYSIQMLKSRLMPTMRLYPGHSFGMEPGLMMSEVEKTNLYLAISDKRSFIQFRMRKDQASNMDFQ